MPLIDPLNEQTPDTQVRIAAAIALSGGGFRAMLFHLGALWRMGQLGFFADAPIIHRDRQGAEQSVGKLERISSVSGGSITSAVVAMALPALEQAGNRFDHAYTELVAAPICTLAATNLAGRGWSGAWPVLKAIAMPGSVNGHVASAYDRLLFKGKTLQDLPDRVRFVFNASNLQSGSVWRFSKPYMRDWRVGKVDRPVTPLAEAVAASSAFPPVLAPAMLDLRGQKIVPGGGELPELQAPGYLVRPALADGGVYDNLGLESCYKSHRTLFVSNAGKPFAPQSAIARNWLSIGNRCIDVLDNQVLSLRKRLLLQNLTQSRRTGAFWDIQQDITTHPCQQLLPCPHARTAELARVPTDLSAKPTQLQQRLINWGYAVTDAALRAWFSPAVHVQAAFPYPDAGV